MQEVWITVLKVKVTVTHSEGKNLQMKMTSHIVLSAESIATKLHTFAGMYIPDAC